MASLRLLIELSLAAVVQLGEVVQLEEDFAGLNPIRKLQQGVYWKTKVKVF